MSIQLTERAKSELVELMKSNNKEGALLRVWVAGGGCSGLSYGMALDDTEPEQGDQIFDHTGVKIVVHEMDLPYMEGSTVDYVEDMMGGGFKIENPNATKTCGCGSSFSTEEGQASGGGCCGGSCGS